jgi:feruloyl esterase
MFSTASLKILKIIIFLAFFATSEASLAMPSDRSDCAALTGVNLGDTKVVKATWVAENQFDTPSGVRYPTPPFCRVEGLAKPTPKSQIRFEIWLPTSQNWNGRYYQHGAGAGSGRINYGALASFVNDNVAGAATDDGGNFDVVLQDGDPDKLVDNLYRGLGETSKAAKGIVRKFYHREEKRRYFEGCSGGGYYAFRAAESFPTEWDGILAGAPADVDDGNVYFNFWNAKRWVENPSSRISPFKLPFIQRAALASCRPQAHVVAGVATDPRYCSFDPAVLLCRGQETRACLTTLQVETLRRLYGGMYDPDTNELYSLGYPPTSEVYWEGSITPWKPKFEFSPSYGNELPSVSGINRFFANIVHDPKWTVRQSNLSAIKRQLDVLDQKKIGKFTYKSLLTAGKPDLPLLRRRGSKILMYWGWADQLISPLNGIKIYRKMAHAMGGYGETKNFFRLFLVPGMTHCAGGPGPNSFGQGVLAPPSLHNTPEYNAMRALEEWVESGRAPDQIIATKYNEDEPKFGVSFTRPICAYPNVAVYKGTGSISEASNFKCENNRRLKRLLLR